MVGEGGWHSTCSGELKIASQVGSICIAQAYGLDGAWHCPLWNRKLCRPMCQARMFQSFLASSWTCTKPTWPMRMPGETAGISTHSQLFPFGGPFRQVSGCFGVISTSCFVAHGQDQACFCFRSKGGVFLVLRCFDTHLRKHMLAALLVPYSYPNLPPFFVFHFSTALFLYRSTLLIIYIYIFIQVYRRYTFMYRSRFPEIPTLWDFGVRPCCTQLVTLGKGGLAGEVVGCGETWRGEMTSTLIACSEKLLACVMLLTSVEPFRPPVRNFRIPGDS